MVEYYNLSLMTNSSNFVEFMQGATTMLDTGYLVGWSILLILSVACFVTLKVNGVRTAGAFAATCWFSMILCWLLRIMQLIDSYTLWGMVILTIASVFMLFLIE